MCAIEVLLKAITALGTVFSNVDQGLMEQQYAEVRDLAAKIAS